MQQLQSKPNYHGASPAAKRAIPEERIRGSAEYLTSLQPPQPPQPQPPSQPQPPQPKQQYPSTSHSPRVESARTYQQYQQPRSSAPVNRSREESASSRLTWSSVSGHPTDSVPSTMARTELDRIVAERRREMDLL